MAIKKSLVTVEAAYSALQKVELQDILVEIGHEGKNLVVTPELLAMFKPDSTGRLRAVVDTSGRFTEASGATIASRCLDITYGARNQLIANPMPRFVPAGTGLSDGAAVAGEPRRLAVTLTTNAGGEVVGPLVALLAGYKACMVITHVFALGTDAAWDLDIEATSGIALGPHPMVGLASVANTIAPDWPQGLAYKATAVAEAISGHITNGGNAIAYTFFGYYWYEAT